MKTRLAPILLLCCLTAVTGCDHDKRMSEPGFRLPEGDPQAGRQAFLTLRCNACHTVAGEELPVIEDTAPPYFELGGEVAKVKTYGDLVTSIINPSHKLTRRHAEQVVAENGMSKMTVYNAHMSVQQLIDLVAYLQPKYDVFVPAYHYRIYPVT